ncbi:MAG: sugar transferase [Parafilimonas sp.]|nr:sugar transferase [Parafilimonas sp.]
MEVKINSHSATNEKILHVHVSVQEPTKFEILEQSISNKQFHLFLKRSFDITIALLLIILFAPILITVALIIKLTSRGPVLYSNERVGLGGAHFKCHKFRSMVSDQASKQTDHKRHLEHAEKGILHKEKNDTRITWIGKIIRKTSIDELPQLFNVLNGDMSIVGPRPLVPFMLKPFPEFKEIRCLVRPGITGLWQIRDREHNTSAEFMIEHDTEYIERYSFFLDMKILAETPVVVLSARGAY